LLPLSPELLHVQGLQLLCLTCFSLQPSGTFLLLTWQMFWEKYYKCFFKVFKKYIPYWYSPEGECPLYLKSVHVKKSFFSLWFHLRDYLTPPTLGSATALTCNVI
jgi:hypothetical protein